MPCCLQRRGQGSICMSDVDGIKFVINFDYPNSSEDYIHRIGRTGRCQMTGTSYAFFTPANGRQARDLVAVLREANQVVNPKLIELARGGFGGKADRRWGNKGNNNFGRAGGFDGPKRWEGKSNIGNNSFAGKMKGNIMANRNKPSRFSPVGKPPQGQMGGGNNFGYNQRLGGDKFNVPPPPSSGNSNWTNKFAQPPKSNNAGTNSISKPKSSVNVREMCNVQGMQTPSYEYPAFMNTFGGSAQMQTVQQ